NATAIEAHWERPFKKVTSSELMEFTGPAGTVSKVPMIENSGVYRARVDEAMAVVEIPLYKSELAFYLLVPAADAGAGSLPTQTVWSENYWENLFNDFDREDAERALRI